MNITDNKLSTRKLIVTAVNSFESVTGKKVKNATVADIEQWLGCLRGMGRSVSTCRTYLSFVKQKAHLQVDMPKRGHVESRTLSDVEVRHMLGVVHPNNYALLAALVLCGPDVLSFVWGSLVDAETDLYIAPKLLLIGEASRRGYETSSLLSYGRPAHFVGGVDMDEIIFPQSHHDINRRLKSIARKAGIGDKNVNITALKNTHRRLMAEYGDGDKAAKALGILAPSVLRTSTTPSDRVLCPPNWESANLGEKKQSGKRDPRLNRMYRNSIKTA